MVLLKLGQDYNQSNLIIHFNQKDSCSKKDISGLVRGIVGRLGLNADIGRRGGTNLLPVRNRQSEPVGPDLIAVKVVTERLLVPALDPVESIDGFAVEVERQG